MMVQHTNQSSVMIFHPLCLSSKYRHDLKSLEADIHGCRKSIRKEEEKNELLVSCLSRSQSSANATKKRIAQCLSRQEALKVEYSTYVRILHETEQALNKTKRVRRVTWKKNPLELHMGMQPPSPDSCNDPVSVFPTFQDQAARLTELLSLSTDIQKVIDAKEQMENEIVAKLQDQMISSKATKQLSHLAAKLHRRKTDLVWCLCHLTGQGKETTLSSVSQVCFVSILSLVFSSATEGLLSL